MSDTQHLAVESANRYLGLKYRHLGRNVHGVDCVGYIKLICDDVEYEFSPTNAYARFINQVQVHKELSIWFDKIPVKTKYDHGDIISMSESYYPCHIGILEKDDKGVFWLLHASLLDKEVLKHRFSGRYMSNLCSVYRFRK